MTFTILRIMYLRLLNNPAELVLVLVLPVVFFSIFAAIFSNGIATGTNKPLRVGWVAATPADTVSQQLSSQLLETLQANEGMVCSELAVSSSAIELDDAAAERLALEAQRIGNHDLIVRIPSQIAVETADQMPSVVLLTDGQNPMAVGMVTAVVKGFFGQWSGQQVMRQLSLQSSLLQGESVATELGTLELPGFRPVDAAAVLQRSQGDEWIHSTRFMWSEQLGTFVDSSQKTFDAQRFGTPHSGASTTNSASPVWLSDSTLSLSQISSRSNEALDFLPADETVRILVQNPQSAGQANPRIAMYAAGIAVLFLLFSATGNAATLLEEAESGTLGRILTSRAGLIHIVSGKWIGIFLLGCLQITVMFAWADLVYDIQFSEHVPGFCIMTASTAAATASFAMLLATLCRTRAQLNAASVVIILSMSAVGGSMIPRFAMSDRMKEIGQWTFNAWALDGYQKVFWYQQPLENLQDEVMALVGSALILGILALLFSVRWKRA